ncbi:TetR/AcrR family transcriptional regulator [Nocardioides sp. NBC_00368]|uniref:TetR/AcrR family transcriptional regulator n=1 Tax=Nocardioides sp. NBC_00368 TaxID=2976000 RepID=UPI0002028E05|nr:TetR/AcrR family transcriptional regulator [Nocardioides sp. NBC_00368]EGD42866.1 putative transcriptional regulator, TetR family [Nocardioidaceae bacterium Broad-1]
MPKLWKDTVAEHRRDVRAAILETAWMLAGEHGVRGVTMGLVAERAGISRATLYKYFRGVDDMLVAGHAEHVAQHFTHLEGLRDEASSAGAGLYAMLQGYARICFHRGSSAASDLHGLVHRGDQHRRNSADLTVLFAKAVRDAQESGQVRPDVATEELAAYSIHALEAAGQASGADEVDRLVDLVAESLHLRVETAGPGHH